MDGQLVPDELKFTFSSLNIFSSTSSSNNKLEEDPITDVEGRVKTRLLSVWNNVKYGTKQNKIYSILFNFQFQV